VYSNFEKNEEEIEFADVILIDTEPCTYTGSPQLIPTSQESVAAL
jgi:hypothetical protein